LSDLSAIYELLTIG